MDYKMKSDWRSAPNGDRAVLITAALTPFIFAVSTWDHSLNPALTGMRQFGFWSLLACLLVIGVGLVKKPSLLDVTRSIPLVARLGLAGVITIAIISAVQAPFTPAFAMMKTLVNVLILVFSISLIAILERLGRQDSWPAANRIFVIGFATYLGAVLLYIATAPEEFDWAYFGLTAQNIRNLGSHMMAVAAFAIGLAFVSAARWRSIATFVAIASVAVLAWSGSRGSVIVLVIGAVCALPLAGRPKIIRNSALLILIMAVGAALSLLHTVDHTSFGLWRILGIGDQISAGAGVTTGRYELWLATIELLKSMPMFGYGDGQFIHVYEGVKRFAFPHNVILQLLFQWGWIGGAIALGLLAWLGIAAFRKTMKCPDERLPAFLVLLTLGGYGMIDGPFYDTLPMMFFAIAAALCLAPRSDFKST